MSRWLGCGVSGARQRIGGLPRCQMDIKIQERAPGWERMAQPKTAYRDGHARAAERDLRSELGPGRKRPVDLDQRGSHASGEPSGIDDAQDNPHLLLSAQLSEIRRGQRTDKPMKQRAPRLKVKTLDVDDPAVTGLHQHGSA